MSHVKAAWVGYSYARGIYSSGFKSANKIHSQSGHPSLGYIVEIDDADDIIDPARAARFNAAEAALDDVAEIETGGNFLTAGAAYINANIQGANCGELAVIAAAAAWQELNSPTPAPIALVTLTEPANHALCAIGLRTDLSALSGLTVAEIGVGVGPAGPIWFVDPWLNIVCEAKNYSVEAFKKLNKWQAANKRVGWRGPQGDGWYPPAGSYRTAFLSAPIETIMAP